MRKAISMQSACNQRLVVLPDEEGHQTLSEAIKSHQRPPEAGLVRPLGVAYPLHSHPLSAIRGLQRSSEVFRGHQRSSEVIRGHQRSSVQNGAAAARLAARSGGGQGRSSEDRARYLHQSESPVRRGAAERAEDGLVRAQRVRRHDDAGVMAGAALGHEALPFLWRQSHQSHRVQELLYVGVRARAAHGERRGRQQRKRDGDWRYSGVRGRRCRVCSSLRCRHTEARWQSSWHLGWV